MNVRSMTRIKKLGLGALRGPPPHGPLPQAGHAHAHRLLSEARAQVKEEEEEEEEEEETGGGNTRRSAQANQNLYTMSLV